MPTIVFLGVSFQRIDKKKYKKYKKNLLHSVQSA